MSWLIALFPAVMFIRGFRRDRRRVSNAMWLGVTLVFSALGSTSPFAGWAFALALLGIGVVLPVGLILNGLEMLQKERRTLGNLLSFIAGIAIVVVDISFIVVASGGLGPIHALLGAGVLLAGYVGFFCTSVLLYSVMYSFFQRGAQYSALIVLGSRVIGDRVPKLLASRLDKAIGVRERQEPKPVVVVSGGQGPDEEVAEATAMRNYLVQKGLPDNGILVEDKSTTTEENLRFSSELLKNNNVQGPIAAVTNNYHAFRAAVTARRLGLPVEAIGAPTANYFLPSAFLREVIALMRENKVAHAILCGSMTSMYLLFVYTR
ncbi:YdcF family protein [Kibdelosporangium philippinense]|uniref:YdcF family protein n=1 Tax=Kibdelosporangium philippinense TaxID=211113 RepID=A0ABS8ZM92_9PSEU|nr:YdcF family protein [Kibdelosporangium philippinense]MCE7008884.1 YdcF family protein [Kibdelosporangium philippinense]